MQREIDFVVLWVDMDDPRWREDFERYSGRARESNSTSAARFRDHGFLKYWLRGVEKFAPWVRRVHFVTCGQKPEWLDESNPRLHLVNHTDYIPAQFLPCFNSGVLESFLHKIPGLSEEFVFFNDDFFLTAPVEPERFFRGGLPCDIAAFQINMGGSQWAHMLKNNIALINKNFNKSEVFHQHRALWVNREWKSCLNRLPLKRFLVLRTPHNAQPYTRKTFEDVWEACGAELSENATHRFRTTADLTQELFRTWQIVQGRFVPYNTYKDTRMFPLLIKSRQAIAAVREQRYKLVCLNDNVHIRNYEQVMESLGESFESILPERSSFEKV